MDVCMCSWNIQQLSMRRTTVQLLNWGKPWAVQTSFQIINIFKNDVLPASLFPSRINELLSPGPPEQIHVVGPTLAGLRHKPTPPKARWTESWICMIRKPMLNVKINLKIPPNYILKIMQVYQLYQFLLFFSYFQILSTTRCLHTWQ
jgi:hypothetical protein